MSKNKTKKYYHTGKELATILHFANLLFLYPELEEYYQHKQQQQQKKHNRVKKHMVKKYNEKKNETI